MSEESIKRITLEERYAAVPFDNLYVVQCIEKYPDNTRLLLIVAPNRSIAIQNAIEYARGNNTEVESIETIQVLDKKARIEGVFDLGSF